MKLRKLLSLAIPAALTLVSGTPSAQSDFPSKPIRLVVGYSTGGPTDVIARLVAQDIGSSLGQPMVVENRVGANGNIATEGVAAAAPDGYTVLVNTLSLNVNAILGQGRVKYDPVRDFAPISLAVALPMYLIVGHDSPYRTVAELLAKARSAPQAVSYGSAGFGGSAHLVAELLAVRSQSKMVHVPFKGNAPAMLEVIAGRVDFMFYPMIGVTERESQKQIRILASTTTTRHPDTLHVPTMAELGFAGFEQYVGPVGFVAPAGTPAPVLEKLADAIRGSLNKPAIGQRLKQLGSVVVASSPSEYATWLKDDHARWEQLIRTANIRE